MDVHGSWILLPVALLAVIVTITVIRMAVVVVVAIIVIAIYETVVCMAIVVVVAIPMNRPGLVYRVVVV